MPERLEIVMALPTAHAEANIEPLNASKKQVFTFAEDAARKLKFAIGDSLKQLVEKKLGGEIRYLDWDDWLSDKCGSLKVPGEDGKRFTIYISAASGPLRNRFTIAHELGHYFLHAEGGKKELTVHRTSGKSDKRVEWQANWFAAAFLMPEAAVSDFYQNQSKDLDRIAANFKVSREAITIRLKQLGLLPA